MMSFSYTAIILFMAVVVLLWFIGNRRHWKGFFSGGLGKAGTAPAGNRTSRISEGLMLFSAGTILFVFMAVNRSTGGRLLILDELRPAFAYVNLTAALAAGSGVLVGLLFTLFWRSWIGTKLTAVILIGYGIVLNGPGNLLERWSPEGARRPVVNYTLALDDEAVNGAKLWVNEVFLGEMPVRMEMADFLTTVPYLEEPPEGYADQHKHRLQGHWISFRPPRYVKDWGPRGAAWDPPLGDHKKRTYYARIKWGDEWGEGQGGGGGGGGGRYVLDYQNTFMVTFPKREKRFDALLQQARLADYHPSPEWFTAVETYGRRGWQRVRELSEKEVGFGRVVDDWVRWKFSFTDPVDSQAAEVLFTRICREADEAYYYNTADPGGRAVDLIYDRLSLERLIEDYLKTIKDNKPMHWSYGEKTQFGRLQIETRHGEENRHAGVLPASTVVIAHALRLWDEKLDKESEDEANPIEETVGPALICWRDTIQEAMIYGGSAVDTYLLRQTWRRPVNTTSTNWRDREYIHGRAVNKWLYLLAKLDSPAGRAFRQKHVDRVMDLADQVMRDSFSDDFPDFLFLDLESGTRCPAYQYRDRVFAKVEHSERDELSILRHRWGYLARMEPVSTASMYADSWKAFRGYHTIQTALRQLPETISSEKRIAVLKAVAEEMEERIKSDLIYTIPRRELEGIQINFNNALQRELARAGDRGAIGWWLGELGPDYSRDWIKYFLRREGAIGHPLVEMLSDAAEAELRLMVLEAVRCFPIQAHRRLLERLSNDSDAGVREAARQLADELSESASIDPSKLVSQPGGEEVTG